MLAPDSRVIKLLIFLRNSAKVNDGQRFSVQTQYELFSFFLTCVYCRCAVVVYLRRTWHRDWRPSQSLSRFSQSFMWLGRLWRLPAGMVFGLTPTAMTGIMIDHVRDCQHQAQQGQQKARVLTSYLATASCLVCSTPVALYYCTVQYSTRSDFSDKPVLPIVGCAVRPTFTHL